MTLTICERANAEAKVPMAISAAPSRNMPR